MIEALTKQLADLQKLQEKQLATAMNDLKEVTDPLMQKFLKQSIKEAKEGKLDMKGFTSKLQELSLKNQ